MIPKNRSSKKPLQAASRVKAACRPAPGTILIQGARENNLKGITLELPLGKLIVVTGVSGSGKSSLAFDTVYSEGQRRYVETFSSYTRQFLDRMDKPKADRIEGIPPAIAIDQTNPVRTSRSTVGTMTELADHLKLLYARASRLYCGSCGKEVRRDTPESIADELLGAAAPLPRGARALITFPITVPSNFTEEEVTDLLAKQGYTRIHEKKKDRWEVIQDRIVVSGENRARIIEDLEAALKYGQGRVCVLAAESGESKTGSLTRREAPQVRALRFSSDLHCADCDIHYRDPVPNTFSFNSPIGACGECRGFGRTIGIDYGLVVPDEKRSLAGGAVKPWQTPSFRDVQDDLMSFARKADIPTDVPWRNLTPRQKAWVIDGEGKWYGAKKYFEYLESKSYKMHIRVLLSKYRTYRECPVCRGARLKPEALLWRIGKEKLTIHEVMLLPIARCLDFFETLEIPNLDEAAVLLQEIRTRLRYLVEVGLGYLTLDRQSRTLSGGEVQRINLTTALGTSLVNALFVLDEPSIGLHPRDIGRLIGILRRLRDAGNTILVVEHDPDLIRAADLVLDMGPGAGELGGRVVYLGGLEGLLKNTASLTAKYLRGEKRVEAPASASPARAGGARRLLTVHGAAEHNLKKIDVSIPLGKLVCITGVSGSGKSTLVEDVLYNAVRKLKLRPAETPGKHSRITGHDQIDDVVLVDQTPIGKTTRSNPASYVGAFDEIRRLFAAEPLSRERGYTAGTFSFNSGTGRCPTCGGSGFEHVEMQFLSDVYIRCPDCDGRRFRAEVLEVKLYPPGKRPESGGAKSISDVLEMTVSEARYFFSTEEGIKRALDPLAAVGMDYVRLGQPVPSLSGGEAQRLKLAGHLALPGAHGRGTGRGGTLFLFDEPTTGLHFDDIRKLLGALRGLIAEGHSVVVIEHNLDVIRSSDWVVDLGPEGGDAGGRIVCQGPPEKVAECPESRTGACLRSSGGRERRGAAAASEARAQDGVITIRKAREHNLKNIDVVIPRDVFSVITGVSGSGKSTVAFDILFAEGQRRYLESLNAYARQFVQPAHRPDVDGVFGVPPTVAIEQRTSRGGRKSTVATLTEIYPFLRLLFVKLGIQHCPECGIPIESQTSEAILNTILKRYAGKTVGILAPLVSARKGYYTDLARWAAAKGFEHLMVDGMQTPTDRWPRLDRYREHTIELQVGETAVSAGSETKLRSLLERGLDFGKGVVHILAKGKTAVVFSTKRACTRCGRSFEELDPRLFSYNSKHGWCTACYGTGLRMEGFDSEQTGEEHWWNDWWSGPESACPSCGGLRLNPEALSVRFRSRTIAELAGMTVERLEGELASLSFEGREREIARDIIAEIRSRLDFLNKVGLSYLSLDRSAPTLSGGEAQRIRLASQLGSNLRGVCYILDEPTIGLHARDNLRLLEVLSMLKEKGNTVVVVEHDEETIRRAEHVVDLGPGGGPNGGHLIAEGTVSDIISNPESATGRYLASPLRHPRKPRTSPQDQAGFFLEISGARLHNLKDLRVSVPLGRLVCVTGVSGSGKSTLVRDILHDNLHRLILASRTRAGRARRVPLHGCAGISGWENLRRALEVDQTPIGKTPRSCPATYVGIWDEVRRLFTATTEARIRGYTVSRFSFNVAGGRCAECEGQGVKKIEMSFLPDVTVVCDACGGKRFTEETVAVRFRDKSVADVLGMSVDEAAEFFAFHPGIRNSLGLLQDVGLGYLSLGQSSPSLSGGEAQRIKLVTELAKARQPRGAEAGGQADKDARRGGGSRTLYVLDEPTIGLHMADVEKLIRVLQRLVNAGNSVVIIEHNLDMIAEADWIIDLGPEGGEEGGRIVAQGDPRSVAKSAAGRGGSYTARFLRNFLKDRS